MVNIDKQITFWRAGAEEDLAVARDLIKRNRIRHGLFFAHLALEKALKAHVCRVTQDIAPPLHNLVRLVEMTDLDLQSAQVDILAEINPFNMEGRYPDTLSPPPSQEEAQNYISRANEVFQWLIERL